MKSKISLSILLSVSSIAIVLLAVVFLLNGLPPAKLAPSSKVRLSPGLDQPGANPDVAVSVAAAAPLPPKIPATPLSDHTIQPSPLTGGVSHLPYVPPSPDTKPEFGYQAGANKVNNSTPVTAAPNTILGPMPAPLTSFNGLDFTHNGAGHPPDTNGDVGLTQYMLGVNTSIGIYNKQTSALLTSFTFNSFWSGAGTGTPCDTTNNGDIIVLYDTQNNHWIFMDFAWTDIQNGPYYFCFGVSQTGDALGNYWRYAIRADDAAHPWLADYPKGGVWPDGLYFSANMFACQDAFCSSATYEEARAYALNIHKMEAGQPLAPADVQAADTNSNYFTLLPSNARRSQPPANTPNYFVGEDQFSFFWDVFKFHVDFTTPANSSLTGPTQVSQTSYTAAALTAPEPAPGNNIDTLADRMMFLNQYRRINTAESLWVQHTVGTASASTPTGIQWAQIDVSGGAVNITPVQQQTFNNGADGLNRFMGSMAVDQNGNAALGYSVSSASLAPDIRYAGRLASDPLSQMDRGETTLMPGVTRSVQTGNCGGGTCTRWGDYSAMTIDPVDDCTFWYANMYFPVQGVNWVARIGSFKFPSCANVSTTSLVSHPNPSTFGQTVIFTATVSGGGAMTPTGVVTFTIGAGLPVTTSLSHGIARYSTATIPIGAWPVTARYSGDANFAPSLGALNPEQTVLPTSALTTTTSLVSHPDPAVFGQTVTLTATVSGGVALKPTGVVTFTIGAGQPVTVNLVNGIARLSTTTIPVGAWPVTAKYGGSASFRPSQGTLTSGQTVGKANTSTILHTSPVPPTGSASLTLTVTVTAVAPGAGTPTGVITITIDGTVAGTPVLTSKGVATLKTPLLTPGTHTIKVSYNGSVDFKASSTTVEVILVSVRKVYLPILKK